MASTECLVGTHKDVSRLIIIEKQNVSENIESKGDKQKKNLLGSKVGEKCLLFYI